MPHKSYKMIVVLGLVILAGLFLAACGSASTPAPTPAPAATCPAPPVCATAAPCPACPAAATPAVKAPFEKDWTSGGHAQKDSEAFKHWDTANPKEIPVGCAKCHSTPGFQDFMGADGSAAGKVDKAAMTGTVITCDACHNSTAMKYSEVTFPSGAVIKGLGSEALCMTCHQGTASMVSVDDAIKKANATDPDKVVGELGFTNIHYFAAAVSRYGTLVKGGYQYTGKTYDGLYDHALGVQTCTDCHDPHTLKVKVEKCGTCHTGVKAEADRSSKSGGLPPR